MFKYELALNMKYKDLEQLKHPGKHLRNQYKHSVQHWLSHCSPSVIIHDPPAESGFYTLNGWKQNRTILLCDIKIIKNSYFSANEQSFMRTQPRFISCLCCLWLLSRCSGRTGELWQRPSSPQTKAVHYSVLYWKLVCWPQL